MCGFAVAFMSAFLPLGILAELVSIGTLFAFVIVCGAVLVMRRTNPNAERPFRAPLVPFVPIAGISICLLLLMFSLPAENWYRLIGWLIIGLMIYFGYGRRHGASWAKHNSPGTRPPDRRWAWGSSMIRDDLRVRPEDPAPDARDLAIMAARRWVSSCLFALTLASALVGLAGLGVLAAPHGRS